MIKNINYDNKILTLVFKYSPWFSNTHIDYQIFTRILKYSQIFTRILKYLP